MADATITVVEKRVVVQPFGADLLAPILAAVGTAKDDAEAQATLSRAYAVSDTDAPISGALSTSDRGARFEAHKAAASASLALAARGQTLPFETLDTSLGQAILVLDADDNLVATIPDPVDQEIIAAATVTDTFETLAPEPGVLLLDADDKPLAPSEEPATLVNAAGTAATLTDRLSRAITPYGALLQADYLPRGAYRNVRARLRRLRNGEATQCVLAYAGDSWIDGDTYWLRQFTKGLQDAYGFGGIGWFGFSYFGTATGTWVDGGTQPLGGGGCARGDLAPVAVFSGTWTSVNGTGSLATPNMGTVSTTGAGAYLRMSFPAGHTGCDLFYAGDGTGVIDYSWDGGSSWTTLALTGVGPTRVSLAGTPSGAATLRIRRNAGTVTLSGINLISTATGVVVHKLGCSGTTSVQWAGINLSTWAAQVALLGPHLVGILLGTNDQTGTSPTPTGQFATNAAALMAAIKGASAAIDRVWIAPPENVRGSAPLVRMEQYTEAVLRAAIDNSFPLHDLQYAFGPDAAEYAFGTTLAYLDSSNLHPSATGGGPLIADAATRLIAPVR